MLVKKACYWWSSFGDFPPEDEQECVPSPKHVLEAYRLANKVSFPQLAQEFHLSEQMLRRIFHIGNSAREQQENGEAPFRANISVAIAEEMGDRESLIIALHIRAATLREQGPMFYNAAQADTDRALLLIKQSAQEKHSVAPSVVGRVTLEAGLVQSFTAQLKGEQEMAKSLLQQGQSQAQKASGEVDSHQLKLDLGFSHLKAAMALTVWHNPATLKEHLDEATRLTDPALKRRHLIIQIVRAQGEMQSARNSSRLAQDKHYAEATRLATEALPLAKQLNSRLNRQRIQEIYDELRASPYGEEPTVAHLGLLLRNWP